MQIHRFVKFQVTVVVGLLFTNGFGEGDDIPVSKVFCTILSGWKDAMTTCLDKGGRPLTGEEIIETNFSNKINFTVWTADYVAVSNRTNDTSNGQYLPGMSRCGSARLSIFDSFNNTVLFNVTAINLGNCMEQRACVCQGRFLNIYPDRRTWLQADAFCEDHNQTLPTRSLLKTWIIGYVVQEVSVPMELDVWIGLLDILYNHTFQGQKETDDIVKYGTFSNAEGFRTIAINQSSEFRALCGLESETLENEIFPAKCLPGKESTELYVGDSSNSDKDTRWLVFTITVSCSVLFVLTCACVVIYIFNKSKRGRIRSFVKTVTSDPRAHPNCSRSAESNPIEDDHGQGDADYSDIAVDGTMYDTTDSEKAKSAEDQVCLHIYDRANYDNGELLYDNCC